MTSSAKAQSNRLNAKSSTGPSSLPGRRRSSQNARKHGLNASSLTDPAFFYRGCALADQLAVFFPNANRSLLLRVSETHLDLSRVRDLKFALLKEMRNRVAANGGNVDPFEIDECAQGSLLFARYEQRALSRRNSAMRELADSERSIQLHERTNLAERSQKAE